MTSSTSSTPLTSRPGSPGTPRSLEEDEPLTTKMRIFISRATGLVGRDRNGLSDPYVKLSIGGLKFTTHVIHKCLNPVWDASFDFDVEAQSMPDKVCLMFWDKDRWNRDAYLGTVYIPFDSSSLWADAKPRHFDDPKNEALWFSLKAIPGKFSKVTGEVQVKFGFIDTELASVNQDSQLECEKTWTRLAIGRNKLGLGQRQVHTDSNTVLPMADIPIAVDEDDASMELSALRMNTPSPPLRPSIHQTPSNFSSLSSFSIASNNLHGVVFMEVVSASNLPRTHNMTRTGFDMDPFVVISFGKYIFRTRVVRHNLNPTWRGKLMFKVHHGEEAFKIKYSVHDWDKLTGNDYIGMATMDIDTLIKASAEEDVDALEADNEKEIAAPDMKEYVLKVALASNLKPPTDETLLRVRAKFVTYTNLRRRFWLGLAKAFDADPRHGLYSKILIQAMLEGLGSTLSSKTVDSFFAYYSKDPECDELTFDELFERLERQVRLDDSTPSKRQKRRIRKFWSRKRSTTSCSSQSLPTLASESEEKDSTEESPEEDEEDNNELFLHLTQNKLPAGSTPVAVDMIEPTESDYDPQTSEDEYVIRIATCPICRDPSLGSKLETDVITHIAVCSGNDGFNFDKLILGNFVTAANAQRKWITKVVKTLGYGRYVIGKSNANIIVQDRTTGVMLEEKMPTFIRLGIRLLYKSPAQKIRVGKILANMTRKQGLKFDDPRSKRSIEPFIRFHHLEAHMSEVLEPVKNFRTFNEFFYRKLKPDARTLASPGDDRVAVSVADCRMTCFQTIDDAQKFWIKGRQFTVAKLLGDEKLAKKYDGGSLAVFRLAPQDYHRFHIPVRGIMSEPRSIAGEYFTVNPMSIRSHLDVYGENRRMISTIESKDFGTVAYCSIGAMMVGSIVLTTTPGHEVERMEEHGYFAFGGSTIVLLFEPNTIQFDEDLLRSSKEQVEMLVRVGMRIGSSTRIAK